jgi:hypothetical protein
MPHLAGGRPRVGYRHRDELISRLDDLRALVTITRTHPADIGQRQVFLRLNGGQRVPLLYGESFTAEVRPGAHHLRLHNTLMWRNIHFTIELGEHLEFIVINKAFWWTYGMVGVLGAAPLFLKVERRSRL